VHILQNKNLQNLLTIILALFNFNLFDKTHYKFITLLHYFINTLIAKVIYMLLMIWNIVPVGSIPTNNYLNFHLGSAQ
jgi:hypothetical protein